RLGGHRPKAANSPPEQWRRSARVFPFPQYNQTSKDGDLMLLKLLFPVHLNKEVEPLPVATSCPVAGDSCQISGWGSTTSPE
ncbi:KLK15 protein, partial [Rhinopomastus cyanomelas]|nr:KLK15 protein [Rhinopomastus cyanomelas]